MSRAFRLRRKPRHYLFWLVAMLLLWQQMALAASVCAMSVPGMAAVATSASQPACMSGMTGHADQITCAQHCAQGTPVQSDARSPSVPGSLLPPLAPTAPTVVMLPRAEASFASADQGRLFRPPLRLLFCSLLI
ncbi:MAG: hypothetical protein OQK79_11930 [Rhodanobacter sp.]|jgi:hypothetical protein|nr:hypothetical protein [Rhodanobacter sp.]